MTKAKRRKRTITTPWGETYRGAIAGSPGNVWSGGKPLKTVKVAAEDGKTRYALAAWLS